jgi:hypothetical protein
MNDPLDKKTLDLEFHPCDFMATEKAASVAKVGTADFCKLAIHVMTRRTLDGEWPPSLRTSPQDET